MTKAEAGSVTRVAGAYDNFVTKTIGVAFPAVAIHQEQLKCLEVLVQNDPDSAVNIVVGNAFEQYVKVVPGGAIVIPINDVNKIWAGTAGGGATVNWIAMT